MMIFVLSYLHVCELHSRVYDKILRALIAFALET